MVQVDGFSVFFHILVIAIAAVVILSSHEYMAVQRMRAGEYYALILFGVVGMALMSSARGPVGLPPALPAMISQNSE